MDGGSLRSGRKYPSIDRWRKPCLVVTTMRFGSTSRLPHGLFSLLAFITLFVATRVARADDPPALPPPKAEPHTQGLLIGGGVTIALSYAWTVAATPLHGCDARPEFLVPLVGVGIAALRTHDTCAPNEYGGGFSTLARIPGIVGQFVGAGLIAIALFDPGRKPTPSTTSVIVPRSLVVQPMTSSTAVGLSLSGTLF